MLQFTYISIYHIQNISRHNIAHEIFLPPAKSYLPVKMNKCLVLALIAMIAINDVITAPNLLDSQAECSPWLARCQVTEQCCRDLICLGYAAKCVPGTIVDDKRPIGDGPFPPRN